MLKKSEFEGKANKIYDTNKKDWESKYYGKVIAIDLDAQKLIAVADSLIEVDTWQVAQEHNSILPGSWRCTSWKSGNRQICHNF